MRRRLGNIFLAAALFLTTGSQWIVLQSIAWAGMMVAYSQRAPLAVAMRETFDGKHPCPLCRAIAAAKKSEKKNEFTVQTKKLEFPPVTEDFVLLTPAQFHFLPTANNMFAKSLAHKPPTPPPRGCVV